MKNEPELYVGRCNGKTLHASAWTFEQAIRESIKGKKPDGDFSCIEIKIPYEDLISEYGNTFIEAVINDLKRHISDTAADILSDNKEYIMSLSYRRIDINPIDFAPGARVWLKHKELVRCKDCVYCKKASFTGELMCSHPSFVHHIDRSDGYCHNGRKSDLSDYLFKEEKPDEEN